MARYGNSVYQAAYYGANTNQLAGSAEPVYAVATDYSSVLVTWAEPVGSETEYIALKLLRNQDAYAETEEDGIVVWSWTVGDGYIKTRLEDGVDFTDVALASGRYVYYRMWLQKPDETWVQAGETYTVVPSPHSTTLPGGGSISTLDKLMDNLPRVFSSTANSPLDEVDKNSTLYKFLSSFAFTIDEFLTLTSLLVPDDVGRNTNPGVLMVKADQFGLPLGSMSTSKSQKRTVREAIYTYSRKGTQTALSTWAESVTGFSPTVTVSPNLMLTNQDSTFNGGVGNWLPVGSCSLAVENSVFPPETEPLAIDMNYTGRAIVADSGAKLVNGVFNPKGHGVPVVDDTAYNISFYSKSEALSAAVKVTAHWFDHVGQEISTSVSDPINVLSTWTKVAFESLVAPTGSRYMGLTVEFQTAGDYILDMFQVAVKAGTGTPAFNEARAVTVYLAPTSSIANPYPNKQVKVVRMVEELYKVLPNNTPYRLLLDDTDPIVGFTH